MSINKNDCLDCDNSIDKGKIRHDWIGTRNNSTNTTNRQTKIVRRI